jgi:predicted RNase H-like nuclease (RuvC/YqgF family)
MDLVKAADEIRVLRESNKELHEMVDDLSGWVAGVEADNDTLRKEIARLKEERDAARRDFCNASYDDPHLVAREREWDCFGKMK